MPAITPAPPPPAVPQLPDSNVQGAGANKRRSAAAAAGLGSTILTSPLGLSDAAKTTHKSLLGE
ncbi:MAG: hypothetical protein HQM01_08215 [Magnetococcales bacterium]|nr:hypothetical protein [Magnetococcales bacterium]